MTKKEKKEKKELKDWYKSLKNCYLDLKTAWGSKFNINQKYKYKILSAEQLKKIGDNNLENRPVVIEHSRGTDRFSIEIFNKHFIDKAEWRNKQIDLILEN